MIHEEVGRLLALFFDPLPYYVVIEDPATRSVEIRMPAYAWAIVGDAVRLHLSPVR